MNDAKKQFSRIGLVLFLGTLLINLVNGLISLAVSGLPVIYENPNLSLLAGMIPMYIISFPLIFLMFQRIPRQLSGEKKTMPVLHLGIAFLICYAGTYLCNLVATLMTVVIGFFKGSPVENVLLGVVSEINPMVNLLIVVICAPIMEELLFRKMIIDRTSAYGEGISVVFSGFLFGLFHGNLVQFTYAFFIGVCFGFVYIKTRNILYPILLHMIINFLGSFVGVFILEKSGYMELLPMLEGETTDAQLLALMAENLPGLVIYLTYTCFILAMVLLGIVLFFLVRKKIIFLPGVPPIERGKRFSTMILNPGVLMFSVFWIASIVLQLFS